jgi:cytochrome c-type biogenesis protein CcmH/NrfG
MSYERRSRRPRFLLLLAPTGWEAAALGLFVALGGVVIMLAVLALSYAANALGSHVLSVLF